MPIKINREKCNLCGECVKICPVRAISKKEKIEIDSNVCIDCGACTAICEQDALSLE